MPTPPPRPRVGARGGDERVEFAFVGVYLCPVPACKPAQESPPTSPKRLHSSGDDIEQRAIAAVFGEAATTPAAASGRPPIAVSSTKGATGHLLGAAGAVEGIFTLLALWHGVAPPTVNLSDPDPPLLAGLVAGQPVRLPTGPRAALSNSFGFGGTNAALVFSTAPA